MQDSTNPDPGLDLTWLSDSLNESDRGCVLIAHAILEERLGDLIEAHVLGTKSALRNLVAELRQGRGNPMGRFASCVDYAQRLGLIEGWMAKALRKVNELRIEFAHYKPPRTMVIELTQAQSIFELLCEEAKESTKRVMDSKDIPWDEVYPEARKLFSASTSILILVLEARIQLSFNKS